MNNIRKNAFLSIMAYLMIYLFGSIFFQVAVTLLLSGKTGYNFNEILNAISNGTTDEVLLATSYKASAYSNFLTYLALFVALVVLNFGYLKMDIKGLKKWYIIGGALIAGIILYGGSLLLSTILANFSIGDSNNQQLIEGMILNKGALVTFFSVGIFAPVVEELIYRKAIGDLLIPRSKILFYIVSILAFGLPHMLSTSASIGVWLLMAIPYLFSGLILALAYERFNNIYVAIIAHMINNMISFFIILGMVMILC